MKMKTMKTTTGIQRLAATLTTLAVIGLLLTFCRYGAEVFFLAGAGGTSGLVISLDEITFNAIATRPGGRAIGLLALGMAAIGSLLPWFALRGLGLSLQRHAPITPEVALAFRRLALSFVAFALLRSASAAIMLVAARMFDPDIALTINGTGLLVGVIAALAAYCVSQILRQAIALAEENQSFV